MLRGKKWSVPLLLSFGYNVDDSLEVLGKKWAVPVLLEILSGRKRFNSILGAIPGMNARTLSARLDEYEESGLIERLKVDSDPPQLHYVLTNKGEDIRQLVDEIVRFSLKWHDGRKAEETIARS